MQTDPSVLALGLTHSYPTAPTKPTSPQPSVKPRPRHSCATNPVSAVPSKPHLKNGAKLDPFPHRKSLCPYPAGFGQSHDPTRLVSLSKPKSCSVLAELSPAEEMCRENAGDHLAKDVLVGFSYLQSILLSWGSLLLWAKGFSTSLPAWAFLQHK